MLDGVTTDVDRITFLHWHDKINILFPILKYDQKRQCIIKKLPDSEESK